MPDYKIVVLGSGGVGKSALTVQFVQGIFVEKYDPSIEDSYRKPVEVDNQHYMLEILDTAGTEQFTAMRDLYMKNGQGFVLVYSIIAQSTFNDLPDLRDQILRVKDVDSVPMVLVGNKCHLADQRVITQEQGADLARRFGCTFLEASAKTKINVDAIFHDLIRQIDALHPPIGRSKGALDTAAVKAAEKRMAHERAVRNDLEPYLRWQSLSPAAAAEEPEAHLARLKLKLKTETEVRAVLAMLSSYRTVSPLNQLQLALPSGSAGDDFVEAVARNETIEKVSISGRSVSSETRRRLNEEAEINRRIMLARRRGDPLMKLPSEPDASGRLILRRVLTSDVPLKALPFAGVWQSATTVDMRSNPELRQFPPGLASLPAERVKEILMDATPLPDYEKSIVGTESGLGRARQILAAVRLLGAGTKPVPLNQIKLIVLGDAAVGKTCLVRRLDNQVHLQSLNSTDGIDIGDVVFEELTFTIYDFGGQHVYRFTHSLFLSSSAVNLILFRVIADQWKRPSNHFEASVVMAANQRVLGELSFWMNSLMSKAPNAKVIFVGTHVDQVPPDQRSGIFHFIKESLQERFVNQLFGFTNRASIHSDVPWFCPISNFDGFNIAMLKESILKCGRNQVLRVPETVLAATKLTSNLLNDLNLQIPVVPMTEFLCRISNQDKPLSFASDVISVLEMLGLIFIVESFSHDQKNTDQAPSFEPLVVFNPQWIADLLASIITTSHSWTRNGFFCYTDLPHIWTNVAAFPPKLWEEMLAILQKCHVIFPVPTSAAESIPLASSSTSPLTAPSSSLLSSSSPSPGPATDTPTARPRIYFVPCLLPVDPPDGLLERWWSKGTSNLFRRRSFRLEAGSVLTIPDGLLPKLVVAMMSSPSLCVISLWQQGALCRSGPAEICLIRSPDQRLLHCGIYVPQFSSETGTASSEVARWLHFFSLIISSLTTSDFQLPIRGIVPCHINPLNGSMIDCYFRLKDLKRLAATGNQAQAQCESSISCSRHSSRLDIICPDLLFADLTPSSGKANRFKFQPSDVTFGKLLGEGAFGSVIQAHLHPTTFPSSAVDDQQVALKFLATDVPSGTSSLAPTGSVAELLDFLTLVNSEEFTSALSLPVSSVVELSKVGFLLCPPILFMKASMVRKSKSVVDLEAWVLRRFCFNCVNRKKIVSFRILTVTPPRRQVIGTLQFALAISFPEDLMRAIEHFPATKKSLRDVLGELRLSLFPNYESYQAHSAEENSLAKQCESFYDELRLMSSLSHANIVHLLGVYIADSPAMVMELIPGGELNEQLDPLRLLKLDKISSFFNFLRTLHTCSNMLFSKEPSLFRSPLPESHMLLEPWRTGPQQVFSRWTGYMKNHSDLKAVVHLHDRCSILAQQCLQGPLTRELDMVIKEFEEECKNLAVVHAKQFITPITWKLRLKLAMDIASGMSYLHSLNPPLLHRDLKTPNVFLMHSLVQLTSSSELPEVVAKIGDFGLSARLFAGRIQESSGDDNYAGHIMPRWVAPEILGVRFAQRGFSQKTTQSAYSLASDVYSYGIILWELLCRELPYTFSVDSLTGEVKPMAVDVIPDEVVSGKRPIIPEDCHPSYAQLVTQCWDNNPSVRPSFRFICGRLQEIAVELGIEGLVDPSPLASSSLTPQAAPNGPDPLAECVPRFESAFAFQSLESQVTATGGRNSLRVESLTVDRTRTQIWIGFSNGAVACSQLQMHDMQRVIAPQFCRPADAHSQRVSLLQSDATHVWTASPDGLLKVWLCHLPNSLVLLDNLQVFGWMQLACNRSKKKLMWVDVQNLRIQCFADSKQGSPLLSLDLSEVTLSLQKDHVVMHYQEGKKARCLRLYASSDSTDLDLWYDKMISMQAIALDRSRLTQVTPCLIAQRKLPEKAQIWLMLQWQNQIFVVITDSGIRIVEWVLESGQQATGVRSFPIISPRRTLQIQIPPPDVDRKLLPGACYAINNFLWVSLGTHLLVIKAQLSHTSTSLSQVAFLPTRHLADISHLISIGDISSFRILSADLTGQLCIWKVGEGDLLEDEELQPQMSSSSTPGDSLPISLSTQLNPPDPIFCMAKYGTRYVWGGARSGKVHIFSFQQLRSDLMSSIKYEQALAYHNAAITAVVPLIDNIIAVGSSDKSISFWRFAPQ